MGDIDFLAIIKNKNVQIGIALLLGAILTVIFYPTKKIIEKTEKEVAAKYVSKLETTEDLYNQKIAFLEEEISISKEKYNSLNLSLSNSISQLKEENSKLSQKTKEETFKLVKPDGTIIEKTYKESDTEATKSIITSVQKEFKTKITEIQKQYESIHKTRVEKLKEEFEKKSSLKDQEYKLEIEKIKQEKITTINEKKFNTEIGATLKKDWFLHSSAIFYNPFYISGHIVVDKYVPINVGIGIGVSW